LYHDENFLIILSSPEEKERAASLPRRKS